MSLPTIEFWITDDGRKRIEDLTREEMLDCIRYLSSIHQEFFEPKNIKARAIGSVEMMKTGWYA